MGTFGEFVRIVIALIALKSPGIVSDLWSFNRGDGSVYIYKLYIIYFGILATSLQLLWHSFCSVLSHCVYYTLLCVLADCGPLKGYKYHGYDSVYQSGCHGVTFCPEFHSLSYKQTKFSLSLCAL